MNPSMLAVIPVRDGVLPAGGDETIAECGGRCVLIGSGVDEAEIRTQVTEVWTVEAGPFEPGRWSRRLLDALHENVAEAPAETSVMVLPGSPDGRDLGPRIAAHLDRPFLAGAISITPARVVVVRAAGAEVHTYPVHEPVVAILQPGVRGLEQHIDPIIARDRATVLHIRNEAAETSATETSAAETSGTATSPTSHDARVIEVLEPDLATIDLSEAPRIIGGGAGLDGSERFEVLGRISEHLGAALGATRVITDRGWIDHAKQIGTTGVIVNPELYLSFGVSGAVQHTAGLGAPDYIISINVDPHCPMMQLSDLAIVADANAVVEHLDRLLGAES